MIRTLAIVTVLACVALALWRLPTWPLLASLADPVSKTADILIASAWNAIKPPSRKPTALDVLPVTDARLYTRENAQAFTLNEKEYCAPRLSTFTVFVAPSTNVPRSVQVVIDGDSLVTFREPPLIDGKPNPGWSRGVTVGIHPTHSRSFREVTELRLGRSFADLSEADYSTFAAFVERARQKKEAEPRATDTISALVRFDGKIVHAEDRRTGGITVIYERDGRTYGSLMLNGIFLNRLEELFKYTKDIFWPCDEIVASPQK